MGVCKSFAYFLLLRLFHSGSNPPTDYIVMPPGLSRWKWKLYRELNGEYENGGVEEIEQSIKIRFVILKLQAQTVSRDENNQIIKRKSIH